MHKYLQGQQYKIYKKKNRRNCLKITCSINNKGTSGYNKLLQWSFLCLVHPFEFG